MSVQKTALKTSLFSKPGIMSFLAPLEMNLFPRNRFVNTEIRSLAILNWRFFEISFLDWTSSFMFCGHWTAFSPSQRSCYERSETEEQRERETRQVAEEVEFLSSSNQGREAIVRRRKPKQAQLMLIDHRLVVLRLRFQSISFVQRAEGLATVLLRQKIRIQFLSRKLSGIYNFFRDIS